VTFCDIQLPPIPSSSTRRKVTRAEDASFRQAEQWQHQQQQQLQRMSFFDQQNEPKKRDADPRVRASGWNTKKLGAYGDESYRQKARQAQANSSSIVGGKIVKPIHAEPRAILPSNVHGLHNNSNASQSSRTGYTTLGTERQRNPPIGATNFAKNAPSGVLLPPWTSAVKDTVQTSPAKEKDNVLPPHLRRASTAGGPSALSGPSATVAQKISKHGTRAAPSMNSGTAVKSAKHSSRFPCFYEYCTEGFEREKDLKVHKHENHNYCRVCDEDFDSFDELLYHKINSEFHICCCVCGDDFHSEGGRDHHQRQVSIGPSCILQTQLMASDPHHSAGMQVCRLRTRIRERLGTCRPHLRE
jgi:hypothetical protein